MKVMDLARPTQLRLSLCVARLVCTLYTCSFLVLLLARISDSIWYCKCLVLGKRELWLVASVPRDN